ncbi:MAG: UDP-3-O-acyl-N-acetylglucosamine deacetylase [Thermodesulfobacteriota bacterium]
MHVYQRTIAKPVSCSGVGVHSGKMVNLTIRPAPANNGIKFVRVDLPNSPSVPALFTMVVDTSLATVIGKDGVIVSTIEHLMASFAGLSIENAIVELDSYEMPILDGSAGYFTSLIKKTGIRKLDVPRQFFVIKEPIILEEKDRSVAVYPSATPKITCTIEYAHPLIQRQSYTIELSDSEFEKEICRARTFGFIQDIDYLKQYGLGRGASLESGIAIGEDRILNEEGLRYPDEFVRHKILDCIGDFSLLGMPVLGHIVAHKSGHAFHQAFLQQFFTSKNCWETKPVEPLADGYRDVSKSLAI